MSLLAAARRHKIIPPLAHILDLKSPTYLRVRASGLDGLIQKSLKDIKGDHFDLSIYFGHNLAKKHDRLARELYQAFRAPLLRAKFLKRDSWQLSSISPIGLKDIPQNHKVDFLEMAQTYFAKRIHRQAIKNPAFSLAILVDPTEKMPPSDAKALELFQKAARRLDMETELIEKTDLGRLSEFDGLFIRTTTAVNHFTFRFAQKAQALGLAVIDDPESILLCTNKVYLEELFMRHKLPAPKSMIIHKSNYLETLASVPLPAVLKVPDSAFSQGVSKVHSSKDLRESVEKILANSDLMIAQEFMPTDFDWRIGLLAGKVIYACKYYMAGGHWQIYKQSADSETLLDGDSETLPVDQLPKELKKLAEKAGKAIGLGLYGVDIKQLGEQYLIIEINDNPSIDAGVEDLVLGDKLYELIMTEFMDRMKQRFGG